MFSTPAADKLHLARLKTLLPHPKWIAGGMAGFCLLCVSLIAWCWPFTERNLLDMLQERSLRSVTIGHFERTYFPPGCIAENVSFLRYRNKNKEPLLTIRKLVVEDYYSFLLTLQHRLSRISVAGLHLQIATHEPAGDPSPAMPLTYSEHGDLPVESITADNSIVDFLSEVPGAPRARLIIRKLQLDNVTSAQPLTYHVVLTNSELSGEISSNGRWGPWNPGNPGGTPLRGTYSFSGGDLSRLPFFAGALSSSGNFDGKLAAVSASGTVYVKDFKLKDTAHSRSLTARYKAVIDGRSADIQLPYMLVQFDHTLLYSKGSITGMKNASGKALDFDLYSDRARAEDLLRLFISHPRSPFRGQITFQAHAFVPPGRERFVRRLQMDAGFGVVRSEFSNPEISRELARLSVSAIKGDKEEDREDPQSVLSDLGGTAIARNGVAHLRDISFKMPGASATLAGTYSLLTYRSDLTGTLLTSGDLSDATSGFKSILLKALTPLFKKHGKVKSVPFRISGRYGNTSISLNLNGKRPQ